LRTFNARRSYRLCWGKEERPDKTSEKKKRRRKKRKYGAPPSEGARRGNYAHPVKKTQDSLGVGEPEKGSADQEEKDIKRGSVSREKMEAVRGGEKGVGK